MSSQFLFVLSLILFVFHVQSSIQFIPPQIYPEEPKEQLNSIKDFEYTLPFQVAKRNLQIVSLVPQESFKSIENTNFSGVVVYHSFPSTFIVGEIFQVRGKITIPSMVNSTFVTFSFVSKANILLKYVYSVTVPAGNFEFSINVDTRAVPAGEYYIGLYPGTKPCYNPKMTYLLKSLLTENIMVSAPLVPTGCSLNFANDRLLVKWKEENSVQIKKITFAQNEKTVEYWLSNFLSSFQVIFKDFVGFTNGTVSVSIQSAFSSSNSFTDRTSAFSTPWTSTFIAGSHNFSFISPKITLTKDIPWIVNVGTNITVEGTSTVAIKNGICMQESSQFSICNYKFSASETQIIQPGAKFSKVITLLKSGTYILQISDINGQCLMNRPIYVGSFLPLVPDFSDMAPSMDSTTIHSMLRQQPQTVEEMRMMLLNHVNEKRMSWGRGPLIIKDNLNDLAQAHSNDMAFNNYLSDVNKAGLGPQARASKAGLNCSVDELVAIHMDLITAHQIMCRTPSHLDIIVRENFTEIGLGVARNAQGYIYITQLFAAPANKMSPSKAEISPLPQALPMMMTLPPASNKIIADESPLTNLTCAQTEALKNEVKDWILAKYSTVRQDPILSGIVQKWLCLKSEDTIFDYTWNIAKYPANFLSGSFVIAPYSTTFTSGFNEGVFLKQPNLSYTKFGIGVMQQSKGKVKVYVEYAK